MTFGIDGKGVQVYTGGMMTNALLALRGRTRKPRPKVHDANLGKYFLDIDRRYRGEEEERVIKLVGVYKFWPKVMQNFSASKKYRYVVVSNLEHPGTLNRKGKVSARILERDYREVESGHEGDWQFTYSEQSVG